MSDLSIHEKQHVTTFMIHSLKTFEREVAIEKDKQIVSIAKLHAKDIPALIADLKELNELRTNFIKLSETREEIENLERKLRSVQRVNESGNVSETVSP